MFRSATRAAAAAASRSNAIYRSAATAGPQACAARAFFSSESSSSSTPPLSYDVVPKEDFGQYKEYSVIFTNRALNLMSDPFQKVMRDLNDLLTVTYNADKVAIIPGSGTFGMESVARQFATDEHV